MALIPPPPNPSNLDDLIISNLPPKSPALEMPEGQGVNFIQTPAQTLDIPNTSSRAAIAPISSAFKAPPCVPTHGQGEQEPPTPYPKNAPAVAANSTANALQPPPKALATLNPLQPAPDTAQILQSNVGNGSFWAEKLPNEPQTVNVVKKTVADHSFTPSELAIIEEISSKAPKYKKGEDRPKLFNLSNMSRAIGSGLHSNFLGRSIACLNDVLDHEMMLAESWAKEDAINREEARRVSNRLAQQRWREKNTAKAEHKSQGLNLQDKISKAIAEKKAAIAQKKAAVNQWDNYIAQWDTYIAQLKAELAFVRAGDRDER